jgi:hypothetical protein
METGSDQRRAFLDRAYMNPAYNAARATRSHAAAMLAGERAAIADDHVAAIAEHTDRYGVPPRVIDPVALATRVDEIRWAYQHGRYALNTAVNHLMRETGVTLAGAAAILSTNPTQPINSLADLLGPTA